MLTSSRSSRFVGALLATLLGIVPQVTSIPLAWAGPVATEWNRKVELVIQSSKIESTLTDFPVLITDDSLPDEPCDADGLFPAQNGGGDIRFTADEEGTTQLPLEVVKFVTDNDPANCQVELWVKVSSVSGSTDTSIWMWYNTDESNDQPAEDSTYGSQNVWDDDYQLVLHLDEDANNDSDGYKDSTSNNNDGTGNSMAIAAPAGQIGKAAEFDGSADYVEIVGDTGLTFQNGTWEAWVNPQSPMSGRGEIIGFSTNGWSFQVNPFDGISLGKQNVNGFEDNDDSISNDSWSYALATRDASNNAGIWENGIKTETGSLSDAFSFSGDPRVGLRPGGGNAFDGAIDEVRVSDSVRSNAWIQATYESASDPDGFVVEQVPQSAYGGIDADLEITKSGGPTVQSGGTVIYTLDAANNGPDMATGLTLTDVIPSGFAFDAARSSVDCSQDGGNIVCAPLHLTPGASTGRLVAFTSNTGGCNAQRTNSATISGATISDPVLANNSDDVTTNVTCPAIASIVRKNANESLTNTAALQDDDELAVLLPAGKTYAVDGVLLVTALTSAPDLIIGFDVPLGATLDIGFIAAQAGTFRLAEWLESDNVPSSQIPLAANNKAVVQFSGTVVTTTSTGSLIFKWAQSSSNANAVTMHEGSYLRADVVE